MKRILACALAVLTIISVLGQSRSDSVKVYFNIGKWQFNPALDENAAAMDAFIVKVRTAYDAQNLDHITIRGYASPDGPERLNERLSVKRGETIADLIISRTGISSSLIETKPQGVSWSEVRRAVAETPEVPYREKVLDILDNTPIWIFDANGRIVDGRKKQLMDLRGGRPYKWMLEHIFPSLRNAVAVSLYLKAEAVTEEAPAVSTDSVAAEPTDTVPVQTVIVEETIVTDDADTQVFGQDEAMASQSAAGMQSESQKLPPIYVLALKTNMLYDLALMPNFELEWLINKNWSVALEANVAWWNKSYDKTYRVAFGSPEVRYHINPRDRWHGMYAGVFAGGGFYDLCGWKKGYRGPAAMAGVSFGYMWSISSCFSLEAGIGAGYMYSHYKHYIPLDGHKVYQRTRNLHYFGPLKLKFSIAWRFCNVNKPKRISPVE